MQASSQCCLPHVEHLDPSDWSDLDDIEDIVDKKTLVTLKPTVLGKVKGTEVIEAFGLSDAYYIPSL